jgi:arginyl-tRNA synthetase
MNQAKNNLKNSEKRTQAFNSYYAHTKILVEDEGLNSRLALVRATTIVLKEGIAFVRD